MIIIFVLIIGVGLISFSIVHYISRLRILKNKIIVEARVVKTRKRIDSESGDVFHPVFRYTVNGYQYETKFSTTSSKYPVDTVINIYCYTKNPKKIILPDHIKTGIVFDAIFFVLGIFLVYKVVTIWWL